MSSTRVAVLLAAVLTISFCLLVRAQPSWRSAPRLVDDFSQYWAAGRVNWQGGDPYSPSEVHELQRQLEPTRDIPTLMWNPPWALAVAMPFGLLPYPEARLLWLVLHLGVLLGCIFTVWRFYDEKRPDPAVLALLVVGFPPALNALGEGQISGLMLLGLVGFLYFERQGRDGLAGACAALTLVKPHLLLLFWCALIFRAVYRARFATLLGAGTTVLVMSCVALAFNPEVFAQYLALVLEEPPYYWLPPTLGTVLRLTFGWELTSLVYVAPVAGIVWVGYYLSRHRDDWQWEVHLPVVLLVSVMMTAYGWVFDQVVLLIPIVYSMRCILARGRPHAPVAVFMYSVTCLFGFIVGGHQLSLVAPYASGVDTATVRAAALATPNSLWFVVMPPVFLLIYVWAHRDGAALAPDAGPTRGDGVMSLSPRLMKGTLRHRRPSSASL